MYDIGRPGGVCAASGQPLPPGTPIVASLVEIPGAEGLARVDIAAQAWDAGSRPQGLFAFWRTIVPEPTRTNRIVLNDDALMDLFLSMDADDAPEAGERRSAFRYLLALLLVRRRRLIQISAGAKATAPNHVMLVRPRGSDDQVTPIEVVLPNLDASALTAATDQLSLLIGGGGT